MGCSILINLDSNKRDKVTDLETTTVKTKTNTLHQNEYVLLR